MRSIRRYDSEDGALPIQTDSSARLSHGAPASAFEYTHTVSTLPKLAGVTFDEQVTNKYPGLENDIFYLENHPVSAKELDPPHY